MKRGPVLAQSDSTGGASLFKDMAACPFRAFAKHRLGARPLEEAGSRIELSRSRNHGAPGAGIHLARSWDRMRGLMELIARRNLKRLIDRGADEAVEKLGPGHRARICEDRRLQKLLAEWLEIEKSRPEFTVSRN